MNRRRGSVAERLERLSVPEPNSGCVLWLGCIAKSGYGRFGLRADDKHVTSAYVAAYLTFVGPVPPGMELDHLCRNRACIAVWHLEPVTHRVNLLRGETQAAENASKETCIHGHAFDERNTYWRPDGNGRQCRTCQRQINRRCEQRRASLLGAPR
jgi:hypothetical protein